MEISLFRSRIEAYRKAYLNCPNYISLQLRRADSDYRFGVFIKRHN